MSRLIDADELIVIGLDAPDCEHQLQFVPIEFIDNAPTVDAVEVIRCKDCKYTVIEKFGSKKIRYCIAFSPTSYAKNDDDYCNYGERKCET